MLKRTKTNLIVHGLVMLAIGLICVLVPEATLKTVAWLLGLLLILGGVLTILLGRRRAEGGIDTVHIIIAILMAAVGIIIIVKSEIIAVLIGLVILLEGIDFIVQSQRYRRAGLRHWGLLLAFGLLASALGIWGIASPWVGTTLLGIAIGVGCMGVSADCFAALFGIKTVEHVFSHVEKALGDSQQFEDAQVVE